MALRDSVTKAMLHHAPIPQGQEFDLQHPYHYKNYADNLFSPLTGAALSAYKQGSGSETEPYTRFQKLCPPKMASIASSSAMTFNLLGDGPVCIGENPHLPQGSYQVQYEKQLYTLNKGRAPANLDAFLCSKERKTAIFCEMKLLEWLGEPGELKEAYTQKEHYFAATEEAYSVPVDAFCVLQELIGQLQTLQLQRYDAWQMLKHLLAIYNHTALPTKQAVTALGGIPSMVGMYDHIHLINVVNAFPAERIDDARTRQAYAAALRQEEAEAQAFVELIGNSQIPRLFDNNCHASIHVQYLTAQDFAQCLELSQERRDYLQRYF